METSHSPTPRHSSHVQSRRQVILQGPSHLQSRKTTRYLSSSLAAQKTVSRAIQDSIKKNEVIGNIAASHPTEVNRVPSLDSKFLFPFTNLSLNPSMHSQGQQLHNVVLRRTKKTFKNTKCPKTSEKEQLLLLGEKFLFSFKNVDLHM